MMEIVTITKQAQEKICDITQSSKGACGIRLSLKKGGCAGQEYCMEPVFELTKGDDKVQSGNAVLYIAAEALLFVLGTNIDYEETLLRSGFLFTNPNVVSQCGCGESIMLEKADVALLDSLKNKNN